MLGLRSESNLSAPRQRGVHPCVCVLNLSQICLIITLCLVQCFLKCARILLRSVALTMSLRRFFINYSQLVISVCECVCVPEAHNRELFTDIALGLVFGRFCCRHSVQNRKPDHRLRLQPHPINKLTRLQLHLIGHLRTESKHKQPIREGFQKAHKQHERITHKQCSPSEIQMMDGAFPSRPP